MDIGGGSTEYIIGTNTIPAQKESLRMGCVTVSNRFFTNGAISHTRFQKATLFVNQQLNSYKKIFNSRQWDEAIGASGSIRAISKVIAASQWSNDGITQQGLETLKEHALSCKHISELQLPELDDERLPVFMGGLAILYATFQTLDIEQMSVSDGALREGLIYDYLGQISNHDIRSDTVSMLASHYHTDTQQAELVKHTITNILEQSHPFLGAQTKLIAQYLNWAADLHEIGRNIAHSQYNKHGAYIIKHGDLAGFSQQDQMLLSVIIAAHRRKIPTKKIAELHTPWDKSAIYMIIILRLAVLLQRNRSNTDLPDFKITLETSKISLKFPTGWLNNAPLTQADLKQEAEYLAKAKFKLVVS
jgi:exopolyphosphatase/guanosine-5'-triphosphate,3'-diphosphate pyrophosphatase